MSMSLHPHDGVRILLERSADAGAPPLYRAAIYTPAERADFTVGFDAAGLPLVTPGAEGPRATPAAVELLVAIARTVARHALAASPPDWPRRVLRWRKLAG